MLSILENETVGAVLVYGAGIAGIQASLDLAAGGFKVYLLDSSAAIGGPLAHPDKTLSSGDCAMCILSPKLVECARNRNIEIMTLADIQGVSGQPGNFKVKVRQNPRYVDVDKCDGCGDCAEVCPVLLPAGEDDSSTARKAISRLSPQAVPNVFAISKAAGQAPCKTGCPAGVNVQGSIALMALGRFAEACDLLRQRCPIPASCGRVCQHPCESLCNRRAVDAPVSFANLERFAGDYIQANPGILTPLVPAVSALSAKAAVIGSGPAGLTAASDLALMGYRVTVFEAKPLAGGMLRYGIPGHRLPKNILEKEIQSIADLGVEIKTGVAIANPRDLIKSGAPSNGNPLESDRFDAVFVATGAWSHRKLGIPGEDAPGVIKALDFLCGVNAGSVPEIGSRVLVIGSSDLALDAARCALRLPGVQSVRLACMESREEIIAQSRQAEGALEEGVVFHCGLGPTRMDARGDRVASVTFRACTSVFENYRGYKRYNPLFDDSQITALEADTVIVAVGRAVDSARYGMTIRPDGRILTDESAFSTSIKSVFAGGDAVSGPASVVEAIAHGHKAAEAMDAYIRGAANIRSTEAVRLPAHVSSHSRQEKQAPNPIPDAAPQNPVRMPRLDAALRLSSPGEIDLGYDGEQAREEAHRCLSCGLCSECMRCVHACAADAILHHQQAAETEIEVGSIILAPGSKEVSERLGLETDSSGAARTQSFSPLTSSKPGFYLAGTRAEDESIREAVIRGSAAAACAMEQLTSVRGTRIERHEYPWERDVADERPRVGVFVCECGHNISSVIDVAKLAEQAASLPDVCHAEANVYTCSESNQQHIKEMMRKHRLNRLVVASCSSPTHEALFQETLRESGLNPYLFSMTNVRDQCSWVHRDDPAAAAVKAADLVFMAVARARHLKQLPLYELPVTAEALVLGGGLAGMTAAQSIAGQGFKVHLVERESTLGGLLRNDTEGDRVHLQQLIDKTLSNPRIRVYLNSELLRISGQVGNFTSALKVAGTEQSINHGVVIVATGGQMARSGMSPGAGNPELARMLGSALTADGYFMEAHSRLRPVDLSNEGEYVCGLAHSPCSAEEAIIQAQAVAARASAILSKSQLEIMGQVATVNPAECVACTTCVKTCPYGAPAINEMRKAEIHSAKCMGCGSCVAACPARAIMLQYQEGEAITSMLDELLVGGGAL